MLLLKWNDVKSAFDPCVKLKNRYGLKQNNTPGKPAIRSEGAKYAAERLWQTVEGMVVDGFKVAVSVCMASFFEDGKRITENLISG